MSILVVFYSRTNTTKKVAEELARRLDAETMEIKTTDERGGAWGYMRCAREAIRKKEAKITPPDKGVENFNLVIIGTPVWAHNMSSPIRAFINANKDKFQKVAFFCTMGGSGASTVFKQLEDLVGLKPKNTAEFLTKEVVQGDYKNKLDKFIEDFK